MQSRLRGFISAPYLAIRIGNPRRRLTSNDATRLPELDVCVCVRLANNANRYVVVALFAVIMSRIVSDNMTEKVALKIGRDGVTGEVKWI